jgi:hypothetical protein
MEVVSLSRAKLPPGDKTPGTDPMALLWQAVNKEVNNALGAQFQQKVSRNPLVSRLTRPLSVADAEPAKQDTCSLGLIRNGFGQAT